MARVTAAGPSNNPLERWDAIRLGGSSSTSGRQLAKSGTSGTTDLPSPAPSAESPSARGPQAKPASSSVSLTDGSGQETGSSPTSLSGSSAGSPLQKAVTLVPDPEADLPGDQLMAMAREAYFDRRFDRSEYLLNIAETKGEDPVAVASARGYVRNARALAVTGSSLGDAPGGAGPSEEVPASGGFAVP